MTKPNQFINSICSLLIGSIIITAINDLGFDRFDFCDRLPVYRKVDKMLSLALNPAQFKMMEIKRSCY
jgi:hypothetical protein